MSGEIINIVLLGVFVLLLCIAAITDIRSRIISNRLNICIAVLAPVYWWANGMHVWPNVAAQIALAIAIFAVFTVFFAMGMMGGGDVKLLAAIALWLPWQAMLLLLVLMSIIGGGITLITIIHHRMCQRTGQPEIPYGVAISMAAIWLVGERIIYQFVG